MCVRTCVCGFSCQIVCLLVISLSFSNEMVKKKTGSKGFPFIPINSVFLPLWS
jgi:hypothetical protein